MSKNTFTVHLCEFILTAAKEKYTRIYWVNSEFSQKVFWWIATEHHFGIYANALQAFSFALRIVIWQMYSIVCIWLVMAHCRHHRRRDLYIHCFVSRIMGWCEQGVVRFFFSLLSWIIFGVKIILIMSENMIMYIYFLLFVGENIVSTGQTGCCQWHLYIVVSYFCSFHILLALVVDVVCLLSVAGWKPYAAGSRDTVVW